MILRTILLLSSLPFRSSTTSHEESSHEQRFHHAVEYWTETLCTLQKTKTIVFHGVFANSTGNLHDFYDILLRTTTEYCNMVILLRTHRLASSDPDPDTSTIVRHNGERTTGNTVTRGTIWRTISALSVSHREWNIRRNWRANDEYYINIWTMNVVLVGDKVAFEKLLDEPSLILNSREHFVVLAVWNDALERLRDTRRLIDGALRRLWLKQRVLNVIFNEPLSSRGFDLYTYDPFAVNEDGSRGRLEHVEATSQRTMLRFLSTLNRRRTIDFHGYPFNVSMFEQGQEGMKIRGKIDPNSIYVYSGGYNWTSGILLGVLARTTNFTVNVIEPNDGELYGYQTENGTFNGAIGDVLRRKVVGSFAFFFVKSYGKDAASHFEFTSTVGFDEVCVITPKADKIPKGLRIYRIYEPSVWLCIVASYIAVCLTWYYAQVFAPGRTKKIDAQMIALRTLLINSGCPIPCPSTRPERCLLLGLFISSVTVVGLFNGMLYNMFANDMHYKEITTLEELDASGLPIGYSANTRNSLGAEDDPDLLPVLRRLQRKMIYVPNNVEMAAIHRNISGLLRKQHYKLISETLKDKNGVKLVHCMHKCPVRFYLACILPSNSFLRERINGLINRLNQAGLPTLWRTRSVLIHGLKMKLNLRTQQHHRNDTYEQFRLRDLHVCFVILASGLLLATVTFLNEIGWIRFNFKKAICLR